MSYDEPVALRRLERQGIAAPPFASPAEAVRWHGVMQGQDYAGALWSVGLRVPGATLADVERALEERTVVRTWALRGTLHLLAAEDLRWIVGLVGERVLASLAGRHRQLGLDGATLSRSAELLAGALAGGARLSRTELLEHLDRHEIATDGQRGYHMLGHAALLGLICQGPAPRNTPVYSAVDGGITRGGPSSRAEALAELARRYFTSHGPATLKDFAWWSGLPVTQARAGLADAASALEELRPGLWQALGAPEPGDAARGVFLLPGFDEFLLGYADRGAALAPEHFERIVPGGNGMFMPTVVSGGRVAGTWRRGAAKGRVAVEPELFGELDAAEHELLAAAAARYRSFAGAAEE